jgi:imidazolonepropionase-like amidohydrolase
MAVVIRFCDLDGVEYELGVRDGEFVDPALVSDGRCIDARQWTALPGLVDAHAHLMADGVIEMIELPAEPDVTAMARHAASQLEAGVLNVVDKGGKSDAAVDFLDHDPNLRPELQMAGEIMVTEGGYYPGFGRIIDPDHAAVEASRAASTRASWVKFIGDWPRKGKGPLANFDEHQLEGAVRAAHRAGARVAVHTMAPGVASAAVRAGVDSIEHGLFLDEEDLARLGARGGAWVPTVAAMESVVSAIGAESSGGQLILRGLANVRSLLPGAVAAGVVVMAGTDLALRHGEVSREAQRLAAYGMEAADVVNALSYRAYEYLGTPWGFCPGARADLVCVDGDPREDLAVLMDPKLVIRLGRVVTSKSSG